MTETYVPGTIGLSRSPGVLGKLIRTGERLSGDGAKASYWNHAFVVVDKDGGTIEAASQGVVRNNVTAHDKHILLPVLPDVDLDKVVAFAAAHLGAEYGYFDDVLLGIDALTKMRLHEHTDSFICSQLAAASLEAGGWRSPKPPALMMPSSLYLALMPRP